MAFIDHEAVQPRGASLERADEVEQVYYVLDGHGVLSVDGSEHDFSEGDMIHLPPGTRHSVSNPHEDWVSYLIMAA